MSDRPIKPAAPRDILLHVADLHFWEVIRNPLRLLNKRFLGNLNVLLRRRYEFDLSLTEAYAQALAGAGGSSVLFTGDFTSTSTGREFAGAREFVDSVRQQGMDTFVLPGNHDVYTFEAARCKRFERHFAGLLPEQGYPARATLPGGTPLLLVPTICPNLISSRGRVAPETVRATRALVEECDGPAIVAAHYPLLNETPGYTLTHERRLRDAEPLRRALGETGKPILFVAGHVHRFSYVQDAEFPNLRHLCTGAFFARNHREGITGEFAEIHALEDGTFSAFRHICRGDWERHAESV